jgi:glycosyltransferase involved in cell wall biosynthesis
MLSDQLVSVIIPTYNRASLISDAVQSVLGQSHRNVEIIVVDDGSTDNTRSVVDSFKGAVRYIISDHGGPAHARNAGMKAATGKYIAFLDSDDIYRSDKLVLQLSFMEGHPEIGMVYTEFSAATGTGLFEEYHLRTFHGVYDRRGWSYEDIFPNREEFVYGDMKPVSSYTGDIFRYVLLDPLVPSPTIMFRREILSKVGYQNEAYHFAEEYEFIVRICKYFRVAFLDVPTYVYRYHEGQMSKATQPLTREKKLTEVEIQKVILQAVLDWGLGDKAYYAENNDWLDPRIAELYHCLGEKWLEYGDAGKARKCFRKGLAFDPEWSKNRQYLYLSFLPASMRRVFWGVSRRIRL